MRLAVLVWKFSRYSAQKITSVNFSNGGRLKIVRLPEIIASLIIRNQTQIEELSVKSYANISTLWIESSPNIPFETIIAQSEKLDRVRLYNVEWETANEASLQSFYNKTLHSDERSKC